MKTEFTPIAMRCTKEQFKAIEPKLKGKVKISENLFDWFRENKSYLTNDFSDKKQVKFTNTMFHNRTVYETWDEATFLKACGIDPDVYTVPKDFILEAHESACSTLKTKIENQFPELFPKAEVGKWYKSTDNKSFIFYITDSTVDRYFGYGILGLSNNWLNKWNFVKGSVYGTTLVEATKEEVETALTNEFFSKAKVGNTVKCLNGVAVDIEGKNTVFEKSTNTLLLEDTYHRFEIFKDGKFAEIISEPIELSLEQIAEKFGVDVSQIKIKK
jgi:hypothetical protein